LQRSVTLMRRSVKGRRRPSKGAALKAWLATVGSVSPLIGLFGTVLGVIEAFVGIGQKGSGNIQAVAPGIGTALMATAAALAVAIPAAFAYNVFAARLNRFDDALEGFGSELIALMVREGRI
jgi:biopolymer transport protein TolQ